MSTAADLIMEWMEGNPLRNAAMLARITGVHRSEICKILTGKTPSVATLIKLGEALPAEPVIDLMSELDPGFARLLRRASQKTHSASIEN